MQRYEIVGTVILDFLTRQSQVGVTLTQGIIEVEGSTAWYVGEQLGNTLGYVPEDNRYESITSLWVIEQAFQEGQIEGL